jgi:hypothetical protein
LEKSCPLIDLDHLSVNYYKRFQQATS